MEMEVFLEQQKKLRARVTREIHFHVFGILLFTVISITIAYDLLKRKDADFKRILAITIGLFYLLCIASGILYLKYIAFQEADRAKLKNWIMWELINMSMLTIFIGSGTKFMLAAPFNEWSGTTLLLMIYWLPLMAYKTAQIYRIKNFIKILDALLDPQIFHV